MFYTNSSGYNGLVRPLPLYYYYSRRAIVRYVVVH